MKTSEIQKRLERMAPGTKVEVVDTTGTEDHFEAKIVSTVFEGKLRIERHRMVMDALKAEMDSGAIHALALKTLTPAEEMKNVGSL